jgi:predicted RNase H-like nuclease (RuvC/YqgF family)
MESFQRAKAKEMEAAQLQHQNELRRLAQQYQRELTALQRSLEKSKTHAKVLDSRVSELTEQARQRERLWDEKERALNHMNAQLQSALEESHRRIEELMRARLQPATSKYLRPRSTNMNGV